MAIPYNLKDAEEVKEFLKNLHIEYKFGCYSEKNAEVCHLLADFNEAIKKDFPKAASLYKSNCDERNFPRSCSRYGDYLVVGKGCEKNFHEAYKYMQKACDLNSESGCLHGGVLAVTTLDLEADVSVQIDKGLKMLNKACLEQKSEKACYYLAGVYLKGIKDHVEKNIKEAYKLSLKSCEYGNPYSCANVAQMHQRGEGVQKDIELAKIFRERADALERELKNAPTLQFQQGIKV
ncbi:hypothetical protein KPH14_001603 [Odynerus spinipes]|uniref:Uncharacterized protein n=1 Tax=Odynerus spinipes TaxID=1348599 RepID=A0AAD9S031_9HYME|nr:hypothetical protein KPH14_001603 [Odynerus spinipes]